MDDFNTTIMNRTFYSSCGNFEDYQDTSVPRTAKIVAILVVGGLGLLGNILIFVLSAHFTVKTNLHHLILSMVTADIIVIIMNSAFTIPRLLNKNVWGGINDNWGTFLCKTKTFVFGTSLLVSLVTLFIITIERFRVVDRTTTRTPYSFKKRFIIIGISWFVSMILSSYSLLYLKLVQIDGSRECTMPSWTIYIFAHFFVLYTLGAIMYTTIFFLSIVTFRRLSKRTGISLNLPEVQRERRRKQMVGAIKMIIFSLLLYSCCYIPWGTFQAFGLIELYFDYPLLSAQGSSCNPIDWSVLNFILSDFLPLINSSFSPCIYIIFLSHFRRAAKKLLCNEKTSQNTTTRNSITPIAGTNSGERETKIGKENSVADNNPDQFKLYDL